MDRERSDLVEKLVKLNRVAKVVKGGRRFSFSALVVVGDQKGSVGVGFGKANDVSEAIRKSLDKAKRAMIHVPLKKGTIPARDHGCLQELAGVPAAGGPRDGRHRGRRSARRDGCLRHHGRVEQVDGLAQRDERRSRRS